MRSIKYGIALIALVVTAPALVAQPAPKSDGTFARTVDNIMRGPDLVGYAPDALRWSADSQKLYFDWRKPGEDEASTYWVAREGGTPTKLTDDQKKTVPPANGRWDEARKRVLFAERGDIVILDGSGTRRWVARTTAGEGSPRWARNDTAVTYVRDGNLFIVPVDGAGLVLSERSESKGNALVQQLTDVAPRRAEPRLTDSQKF